ncbi:MAG TPA: hypothetical protein VGN32_15605 [Ktedonobacterales bacterium]|jgi:hypothetical protein|nr:hypothetical protein [Ktedonobacterales bacterium]
MRAVDDDTQMKVAVLRKLWQWGSLPESDVSRMLPDYHLITDDFRDMEEEGLIEMAFIGDEYVLVTAILGRLFLERQTVPGDA